MHGFRTRFNGRLAQSLHHVHPKGRPTARTQEMMVALLSQSQGPFNGCRVKSRIFLMAPRPQGGTYACLVFEVNP